MHMKMGVGMFAKQLLKLLVQLLKTFVVLRDGERRSGRLTIAAEKGHAMPISGGIDTDADVGHGVRSVCGSCHEILLIATSSPLRSHETPPVIFGLGNPCDKRSRRMMYQFLIPKVGGKHLSQVVEPQDGVMIPRDSTRHQSSMRWSLAV